MVKTWSWTVVTQQREEALTTGAAGDTDFGRGDHVTIAVNGPVHISAPDGESV